MAAVNPDAASAAGRNPATQQSPAVLRCAIFRSQLLNASNSDEIDAAFAILVSDPADALLLILLGPDAFFNSRRVQIAILAARHMVPVIWCA